MNLGTPVLITYLKHKDKTKINTSVTGILIDILPKLKAPPKYKVLKYYGKFVEVPKFGSVFGPINTDRLIIQFKDKSYGIFPEAGNDRYFIIKETPNV